MAFLGIILSVLGMLFLSGCGIVSYPGQPGVVTNGYAKIDIENLTDDGLYVFEAVYDNRPGGKGVGALITKLYPKAATYTSNVRTNADGTLYRVKGQYEGAEVQMISIPSIQQVHLSPQSKVGMMIQYESSLDEVDDRNLSEEGIFKMSLGPIQLRPEAIALKRFRWDLMRAGRLLPNGQVAYEIMAMELAGKKFVPHKSIVVETNFLQNSLRTNITKEGREEAARFLESYFPKGYSGPAQIYLKGATSPLTLKIGLNTIKTAEASGMKIIHNASESLAEEVLKRFQSIIE